MCTDIPAITEFEPAVQSFFNRIDIAGPLEYLKKCLPTGTKLYVAGGAILSSLLPDVFSFQTGMLVTAIAFVGITLIGGFWAAGLTSIINVVFIYAGVVVGAVMGDPLPEHHR